MIETERRRLFQEACDAVRAVLPDAWAIYVYGSYARGEEWPGSDLDLAVLLPPGNEISDTLGVIAEISSRVGRNAEIADLRKAGDVLRHEVLADGTAIYVADPALVLAWEASAMSRYARHREEIRDILEDFRRSGVGYGS